MDTTRCPQSNCSSPARLLFSLVCSNPKCRNYDTKWHTELNSKPRYEHNTVGDHIFLGGFMNDSTYYDLYHSINPLDDTEWVEARYGNELSCYLGDELLFACFHEREVLQEAARRWNSRIVKVES